MQKFRTKLNSELASLNWKLEFELKTKTGSGKRNPEPKFGNSGIAESGQWKENQPYLEVMDCGRVKHDK